MNLVINRANNYYCSTIAMAAHLESIPVIDISPLVQKGDDLNMGEDSDVAEVVRQLDKACREDGVFYVKGHGIPDSLMNEIKDVSREFLHLPNDEREKIKLSSATGYRGFRGIGDIKTAGQPDMQEALDIFKEVTPGMYGSLGEKIEGCNLWPTNPSKFRNIFEKYINMSGDMCRKVLRGLALALGGPIDTFEGNIAGDAFWLLSVAGYPVSSLEDMMKSPKMKNSVGCGAHTDYGLLTMLNQDDDVPALQVKNKNGEWISALPLSGTFVCLIGDMLKILTNGMYEAAPHMVINNTRKYRVSVIYFYETNFDAHIEPLDICTQKTGGINKLQGVVYGKHLINKMRANFDE